MNLFEYLSESRSEATAQRAGYARFLKRYWLAIAGFYLVLIGMGVCAAAFDPGPLLGRALLFIVGIAMIAAGVWCGMLLVRRAQREAAQKKYIAILAGVETMRVQEIAAMTNQNQPTVLRDIQGMIDSGDIDDFYIDYSAQRVVSRKHVPTSSSKAVVTCAACGTNNEVLVGVPKPCNACGEPLMVA